MQDKIVDLVAELFDVLKSPKHWNTPSFSTRLVFSVCQRGILDGKSALIRGTATYPWPMKPLGKLFSRRMAVFFYSHRTMISSRELHSNMLFTRRE